MEKYLMPVADFLEKSDWLIDEPSFICLQYELVDEMEKDVLGFEIVPCILELMEANPLVEFGTPGPFTHYMEKFYAGHTEEYTKVLKESVAEKPTVHTVWLLHRVIFAREWEEKTDLINVLKSIAANCAIHEQIREATDNYLEYHL